MPVLAVGRQIERRAHLGGGAGEVEQHLVARDAHLQLDADQPEPDHVGLEVVAVPVAAVGHVGDDAPRLALRVVEGRVDGPRDPRAAVAFEQRVDAALGGGEAGEAGAHVAPVLLRGAGVGEEEVEEGAIQLARPAEALRRDADALLVDLEARGGDAAGDAPADVVHVDEAPRVAHEHPLVEHRLPQEQVREVGDHPPGAVRVVGEEHVPLVQVLAHAGDGLVHGHADHHQHPVAARRGEHLALGAHQHRAVVLGLLHEHGVRGAVDDLRHLVHDRLEAVDEDLQGHLVEPGHRRSPIRFRCSSTRTPKASGT